MFYIWKCLSKSNRRFVPTRRYSSSNSSEYVDPRNERWLQLQESRTKAKHWYWNNRLKIMSENLGRVVLIDSDKVIKSFDTLLEAEDYRQIHCPEAFMTVVGDELYDKRVL